MLTLCAMAAVVCWPMLRTGKLRIVLDRPDEPCEIRIDGRSVAVRGPENALSLRLGRHELSVRMEGHDPWQQSVTLRSTAPSVVFVDMAPPGRSETAAKAPAPSDLLGQAGRRRLVNPVDGSVLVLIPAGKFISAIAADAANFVPMALDLPDYYLGLTEATNAQYRRFVDATGHPSPDKQFPDHPVWKQGAFAAEMADHPVVGVNWHEAQAYCRWAGLRLPTELEWEKGARGLDGWLYPWGNDFDATKCRSGQSAKGVATCSVWQLPEGRSPWGLYHMAGNVWEWCADWFDENAYARYARGDLRLPEKGATRVIRGGAWDMSFQFFFNANSRSSFDPDRRSVTNGFRVAADPPKKGANTSPAH